MKAFPRDKEKAFANVMLKGESEKMSGWQNQETVYLVMWRSRISGATLSQLRKSDAGLERLLLTLEYLGYDRNEIVVIEQEKAWMPEKKKKVGGR